MIRQRPLTDAPVEPSIVPPSASASTPAIRRLLHWHELEDWQKDNEFIHTGYVKSENSYVAVLKSLGYVHNETGNIYTHLVPSLLVLGLLTFVAIEASQPMTLFGIGCVVCLGMSATYHLFSSHSARICALGNKLDYVGITILIAASMVALIEVSYNDLRAQRNVFVAITSTLGLSCSVASLSSKFKQPAFRPIRAAMFVLYGLSGLVPIVYGTYRLGYAETRARSGLLWLYTEAFMYIFGAFLYAIRFPEKWGPGRYDIVGHSHQVFHVFVVLGAYSHYRALVSAEGYALERLSHASIAP